MTLPYCFPARRSTLRIAVTFLGMLLFTLTGTAQVGTPPPNASPEVGHAPGLLQPGDRGRIDESYGRRPLRFEPNAGQTDPAVRFLARGSGYTLFLTDQEAVLKLGGPTARRKDLKNRTGFVNKGFPSPAASSSVVRIKLAGSSSVARPTGLNQLPGETNYFVGSDPTKWKTHVKAFGKVQYVDVYPGVDLVYYGNQGQLEYDFVVRPGATPESIRLEAAGAGDSRSPAVQINHDGDLVLGGKGKEVVFKKPVIYQAAATNANAGRNGKTDQSSKTPIDGRYVLLANNQIGFEVGTYDRNRPLIIDPVLAYSTYLGGTGSDEGNAIAVDSSGNAYIAGMTNSTNFPVTSGVLQNQYATPSIYCALPNPCDDGFVTKISADGSTALYSTYLGGSGQDEAFGIAVDSTGAAYVTGFTNSTNFPVTAAAFQKTCAGQCLGNAFVAKLSPDGSSLVYSTYLGGSDRGVVSSFLDTGWSVALDSSGSAYITGMTNSPDFPVTPGAFQTTIPNQTSSAFITKLNAAGSALVFSTFLAGSTQDSTYTIAVDSNLNVYVVGMANSPDFPTTPGALQIPFGTTNHNVPASSFVTKLKPDGSGLVYSSLLGGKEGGTIAVDSSGSAYVAGLASPFFPITMPVFGANCGYGSYVAKLTPDGSGLVYSDQFCTPPPGDGVDALTLAVDPTGSVYVTGATDSTAYLATAGSFQPAMGNPCCYSDVVLEKLTPDGTALMYSTYLGGEQGELAAAIALGPAGDVFLTGWTDSTLFPTASPLQSSLGGGLDAFVSKLSLPQTSVSIYPAGLNFGSLGVGFASSQSTVTLANVSDAPAAISNIAASGDFAETNNCGSMLEASAQCSVNVTFAPTATGARTGTLAVNAAGSSESVALTGTGVNAPVAVVSPPELDFVNHPPSSTSPPEMVTVTNAGNTNLHVNSTSMQSPFGLSGAPCSDIAAQSSCSFAVDYWGSSSDDGAAIILQFAGGLATQYIPLNGSSSSAGNGVPFLSLGQRFAPQAIGTTSSPQTGVLFNSLSTSVTLSSPVLTGDFSQTNNCGATLAAGSNCTFTLTFSPAALGIRQGTLQVSPSGTSSPSVLYLLGTGVNMPVLSPSAPSLSFGNQIQGTTSAPQALTLTNAGAGSLGIRGMSVTGDFSIDTSGTTCNLGATLAAGGTCTLSLTFTPTAPGARAGTLTLTDNAADSPQAFGLSGTGIGGPAASLSSPALTFTAQQVGSTSAGQSVTLTNTGGEALTITSISASGNFAATNTCGTSVAAGANCAISVTFTPTATGSRTGTLTITDNAPDSPQSMALTGTGTGPVAGVSPASLTFTGQMVGSTSSVQTVTLANTGNAALAITSIAASGDFAATNTCGSSVAAGANCTISVTFHPTAGGSESGTLTITDNAPGSPHTVSLAGTGEDFSLGIGSGSSTTATVTAGQTATYSLNMTGLGGMSQTINFSCTGAPSEASCTVTPSSAAPSGSGSVALTVSVTTTAASLASPNAWRMTPPNPGRKGAPGGLLLLGLLTLAALAMASAQKKLYGGGVRVGLALAALAMLTLALAACGGGGGGTPVGPSSNPGTPQGTYTLTVTGTVSGSTTLQHSTTLTLKVD